MTTTAPPTISLDDIRRTAEALEGVAVETPLVESAELSRRLGVPVWVKCEMHQPIGAFKVRGAYTAISRLTPEERARGIVTHSSGNHAQAVAFAARRFGARAVIVMAESAPAVKVEGTRRHGGEIVFTSRKEREATAEALIEREGLVMVAPYDNYDVIMGQATCAYEIFRAQPGVETIVCPIGGGGMLAGTCAAVGAIKPETEVRAVEPALHRSSAPRSRPESRSRSIRWKRSPTGWSRRRSGRSPSPTSVPRCAGRWRSPKRRSPRASASCSTRWDSWSNPPAPRRSRPSWPARSCPRDRRP
ncbi:MAG: pyridoxal-phosphate dependent enzyme [Gemmatimonadales bacterium]